jgi:C4-dicarboxylate transporter DctM subunit
MDPVALSSLLIVVLFLVLGTGIWIALALGIVAYAGMAIAVSAPPGQVLATSIWGAATSWDLTALPMFIWMGEILYRTRLSQDMFAGLAPWMRSLPGRLLHVNVVGCTIFAAVSGSSAATCATIGRISLPELQKRGYDERLAIGTLAGAGTLGLLIPPSLIMIVYGAATEQSIARLFIAGVVPGVALAGLSCSTWPAGPFSIPAACRRQIPQCRWASALPPPAVSFRWCSSSSASSAPSTAVSPRPPRPRWWASPCLS